MLSLPFQIQIGRKKMCKSEIFELCLVSLFSGAHYWFGILSRTRAAIVFLSRFASRERSSRSKAPKI